MSVLADSTGAERQVVPSVPRVPWSTVIPLAVVLAYADGFWVIALRGAAGAVERADAPTRAWLTESTMALPVFVFAVLAALTLARSRFGLERPRGRALLGTLLVVVAGGTLAGAAGLVASSAYDYQLQAAQLAGLETLHGTCGGSCAGRLRETLDLQVRSVAYGSALMLVSNVVLTAWLVALRGGRLALAGRSSDSWPARRGDRPHAVRLVLAAALAGAGAVHAAVVPEHAAQWTPAGVLFVVLAVTQMLLAVAVPTLRGTLGPSLAAAAASGLPLIVWLYSRTLGLPFGPEAGVPEPVGVADVGACALEILALVASVLLLVAGRWLRRPLVSGNTPRLLLVAVVAVAVLAVGGGALDGFGAAMPSTSRGAH